MWLNFELALSPPKYQGKKWKVITLNFQLAQNPSNPVDMFIFNSITLSSMFSVCLVDFQLFTFNFQLLSTVMNSILLTLAQQILFRSSSFHDECVESCRDESINLIIKKIKTIFTCGFHNLTGKKNAPNNRHITIRLEKTLHLC